MLVELLILMALAVISDFKTYKIKNVFVLPFVAAGLVTNLVLTGTGGLLDSALGALVPVILLFFLYSLRMLGAGDIKLFSAIGAVAGLRFGLFTMAYALISGGIIALVLIAVRRNGAARLKHLHIYLKSSLLTLSFQPYTSFEDKSDGAKFHMSAAAAAGVIIALLTGQ